MIGLPRSTYYRRPRKGDESASKADGDLRAVIAQVQRDFPGYGYRRITRELRAGPHRANHQRVQRVQRVVQAMLHPPSARRRPWVVAKPDAVSGSWYPNLRAGIIPTGPNQLWVSDITSVRLERAFVFFAVVLDVFSRKVIG